MHQLSLEAKSEIIRKALKTQGKGIRRLAEMHNIGYSTLQKWIKRFNEGNDLTIDLHR
jgi:transposase